MKTYWTARRGAWYAYRSRRPVLSRNGRQTMKTERQGKKEKRSKSKSDTGKKPFTMRVLRGPFRDKDEFSQWIKSAGKNPPRPGARIITAQPFRDGGGYIVDWEYAKERQLAIQVELTDEEKAEISAFVGQPFSYGQHFIDALRICLAQRLNDPGLIDYTWDRILAAARTLSQSGKTNPNGKPVAPAELNDAEQEIAPGILGWIKGWLWRLYEKTLKVVVEAILERFWPK